MDFQRAIPRQRPLPASNQAGGGWITVKILLYIEWAFSVQRRHENPSSYTRLDLNSLRGAGTRPYLVCYPVWR